MATSNVAIWQSAIDGLNKFIVEAGQDMEIQTRSLKEPNIGSVDFGETFVLKAEIIGAVDTKNKGRTIFDGSSVERVVSHTIYFEFIEGITAEDWVLYDNRRFDILDVEDIGELNGIIKLDCNERGTIDNEANKA